jgi:hypothetical protein
MAIILEEAHLGTNDPDAGRLLERLVRQVRHQYAGVWMLSQKVDEFTRTELGRTLTAVASTKIVLGHEESPPRHARSSSSPTPRPGRSSSSASRSRSRSAPTSWPRVSSS